MLGIMTFIITAAFFAWLFLDCCCQLVSSFEGRLSVPEVSIHTPREDHQCYNPVVVPTLNT